MALYDRFVPMEKFSKVADATDATNNYVEFTVPANITPVGIIAQVRTVTTGVINITGLTVTQPAGKIRVAVTDLLSGDTVSCICFE